MCSAKIGALLHKLSVILTTEGSHKLKETMKILQNSGVDLHKCNSIRENLMTLILLRHPKYEGLQDSVKFLLDTGATVSSKNWWGKTPLHCAVSRGLEDVAELLISRGAQVNAKDINHWTPLHRAVLRTKFQCVEHLLRCGANVNAKDRLGNTPLHQAVSLDKPDLVQMLVRNGADVGLTNNQGMTPSCKSLTKDQYYNDAETQSMNRFSYLSANTGSDIRENVISSAKERRGEVNKFVKSLLMDPFFGYVQYGKGEAAICNQVEILMSRLCMNIADRDPRFTADIDLSGSVREGTKVGYLDELDYMFYLPYFAAQTRPEATHSAGFMKLRNENKDLDDLCNESGYVTNLALVRRFGKLVGECLSEDSIWKDLDFYWVGSSMIGGSSQMTKVYLYWAGEFGRHEGISVDLVPTASALDPVGFSLVAKRLDKIPLQERDSMFRMSYSNRETLIMRALPFHIKMAYVLSKCMVQASNADGISSFMLKNALLCSLGNTVEEYDPCYFSNAGICNRNGDFNSISNFPDIIYHRQITENEANNIRFWAVQIFERLETWFRIGIIPTYFTPDYNINETYKGDAVRNKIRSTKCKYFQILLEE